jgi:protein TonB
MVTRTAERHPVGALGRMGVVAALHVGLLFVIARSMGIGSKPAEPDRLVSTVIQEARPSEDPIPQPNEKTFLQPPIITPLVLPPPVDIETESIDVPPPDPGPVDPPSGETFHGPVVVAAGPDARYPFSLPPYPPEMIRQGNTGSADVEVYVLPNGRVGDARIVKSTGFDALDRSTIAEAKRNWRLMPATRDGVPFAQWHRLRVVFKLNQR